jgi:hypothetical protein
MGDMAKVPEELYELMLRESGLGSFEMSDRDMGCVLLPDLDYEAQLIAVSGLLQHNDSADAETRKRIKEVEEYARDTSGGRNERAVDEWVDLVHGSTYQSAAHSMAALGMLAPLYESMFFQAFQGIGKRNFGVGVVPLGNSRAGMPDPEHYWDCHWFYNAGRGRREKNLVAGIEQLADAVGPRDIFPTFARDPSRSI